MRALTRSHPSREEACRNRPWLLLLGACVALLGIAAPARAQLRPLDPLPWSLIEHDDAAHIALGAGLLHGQRASLAGTRGRLIEAGNWLILYRSGRLSLHLSGTAVRRFDDREVLVPPFARTDAPDQQARVDAGDVRAATLVHIVDDTRTKLLVRFGTRLPTPSDEPGLDRDRTDFFATAAARRTFGRIGVSGEAGVGINGTMLDDYPQSDVLIYAAQADLRTRRAEFTAAVTGHDDLHTRVIRGNEDLAELRFGVRTRGHRWVEAHAVRGLAEFSPAWGLLVRAGIRIW